MEIAAKLCLQILIALLVSTFVLLIARKLSRRNLIGLSLVVLTTESILTLCLGELTAQLARGYVAIGLLACALLTVSSFLAHRESTWGSREGFIDDL